MQKGSKLNSRPNALPGAKQRPRAESSCRRSFAGGPLIPLMIASVMLGGCWKTWASKSEPDTRPDLPPWPAFLEPEQPYIGAVGEPSKSVGDKRLTQLIDWRKRMAGGKQWYACVLTSYRDDKCAEYRPIQVKPLPPLKLTSLAERTAVQPGRPGVKAAR